MSKKKAENKVKITALYCRLSVEDTKDVTMEKRKWEMVLTGKFQKVGIRKIL